MKNKKLILVSILFLFVLISSLSYNYAKTISKDLENSFFRLHIVANSNTSLDQNLKLKVRDSVLDYIRNISNSTMKKEDIINFSRENINTIQKIAEDVIISEGFNYPVNLEIGNFYFPTKTYGNISLPAGYYDSLKIEIGDAQGQNWWCSLFPPLCFIDISSGVIDDDSKTTLENNLNTESFLIITDDSKAIKLKIKVIEFFSK